MANAIDLRDWPLIRIAWPMETTPEFLRDLRVDFAEALKRRERFAQLTICPPDMKIPSASQRAEMASIQGDSAADLARYCFADAMVLPSPLQRGVVTVLNWLAPSGHPQNVFGDVASARAWLAKRFADEKLPFPGG